MKFGLGTPCGHIALSTGEDWSEFAGCAERGLAQPGNGEGDRTDKGQQVGGGRGGVGVEWTNAVVEGGGWRV